MKLMALRKQVFAVNRQVILMICLWLLIALIYLRMFHPQNEALIQEQLLLFVMHQTSPPFTSYSTALNIKGEISQSGF